MSDLLPGGITAALQGESVRPNTLVIKPVPFSQAGITEDFAGVFGGKDEDVWVATFLDPDEAEAWIIGNKRFGMPIKGAVLGTRSTGGKILIGDDGSSGRSRGEVQGNSAGGAGSILQLPDDAL